MRTMLLVAVIALFVTRYACASGPPVIIITSGDSGLRYRLEPGTIHAAKEANTIEEVGAWMSELIKMIPEIADKDIVLIYPDERTSFRAVLDLLRRLKAAGVVRFMIMAAEPDEGAKVMHSLSGRTDNIRFMSHRADKIDSVPSRSTPSTR